MGKVEGMIRALDEMAACSERLMKASMEVRDLISGKNKAEGKPAGAAEAGPEESAPKKYTFVEVRQAFSAKAHEGHTEEVRALIAKYGADRLSAVREEDYAAIMADLEAIS